MAAVLASLKSRAAATINRVAWRRACTVHAIMALATPVTALTVARDKMFMGRPCVEERRSSMVA